MRVLDSLFCMDNLELLESLSNSSVDLIYCDVLYNTGKRFKDYEDSLGTPSEAVEWYEPRLKRMFDILNDTGSIYIQCDWHLSHYLKVKMDEIFGINNFVNEIVWGYTRPSHSKQKNFTRVHDIILFYAKNKGTHVFNADEVRIPYSEETIKRNNRAGGSSKYNAGTGERKFHNLGKIPESYWIIPLVVGNSKEKVDYDTQKPKKVLERIIKASSNRGDVVADFFCGSGTSMVVANELGRKYIGCDINPKAIEIANKRLNKNIPS